MTLEQLTNELYEHIRDEYLRDHFFTDWINDAVLGLATDFLLPALKRTEPYNLSTTTSNWLYALPDVFHKKLFRCRNELYDPIRIVGTMEDLDALDFGHTIEDEWVSHVAINAMKREIAVYPKADDTLRLWFYERPTPLELPSDTLTCVPDPFQRRVVIPKVVVTAFPLLQDMGVDKPNESLRYWQAEYSKGLFGSPKGEIGMVQFLASLTPPKIHLGQQFLR